MISNKSNNNNGIEENANTEDEKLLILPLNDKNSKKISQIISNDTARNILEAIASEPLSASRIAEKLRIPLTTVQYNLDKLNNAGLAKVERTKYSEKMKEVKIYAPQRKFVVIVPEKTSRGDVIATLKRYLTVIFFAVAGSGIIEFFTAMRMKMKGPGWEEATGGIAEKGGGAPTPTPAPEIVPSPMPAPVSPERAIDSVALGFDVFAHPGLWFLFGCLFLILVVFLIEYLGRKKEEKD
ncbi:MAG: winged helix-turn-helix domain-containing protein [Euryarchaeota archaeon]|nr:winged helix-turn-helix domain-containing protein [Euryarchaeota archaeon]